MTEDLVESRLEKISSAIQDAQGVFAVYVVGMGAQHKELFGKIDQIEGATVCFHKSILSGVGRLLVKIVASYRGLVRIELASALSPVFKMLTNRAMAGIYICSQEYAADLEESVRLHRPAESYDYGIKADAGYFFYVLDADNAQSDTGMVEIVSYGKETSKSLRF